MGVQPNHVQQGHGLGQFTALAAVVLTDGRTLLEQFVQILG